MNADRSSLCREIRAAREQLLGISQEEAARRLGTSLKAYRAYETFREPRLSRLRQLEAAFGLEEGYFLRKSRPPPSDDLRDELARRHEEVLARLDAQDEAFRVLTEELSRLRSRLG